MESEISAATVANPLEEEEPEGFIEGDDDLLRAPPHDLANLPPALQVNTRRQEELGGGPIASFARCRDRGCSACSAPDCGGLHNTRGLRKLCLPCHHSNPSLCVLRCPCLSWDFEKIGQFRSAQEAFLAVGEANLLVSPEPPHMIRIPVAEEHEAAASDRVVDGAAGWTPEERLAHERQQRHQEKIEQGEQFGQLDLSDRRREVFQQCDDEILSGITPRMEPSPSHRYQNTPPIPSVAADLRRTEHKQDLSQLHGHTRVGVGGEEKFTQVFNNDHIERRRDPTVFGPRLASTPERSVRFNLSGQFPGAWAPPPQGYGGPRVPGPRPPTFQQAAPVSVLHPGGQGQQVGQGWQGQGQQTGPGGQGHGHQDRQQVGQGWQGQGQQGRQQVGQGWQGQGQQTGPGGQGQGHRDQQQVGQGWQEQGQQDGHQGPDQQSPFSTWWSHRPPPPDQSRRRSTGFQTSQNQTQFGENVAQNQHKIVDYLELMTEKLMAGAIGGGRQQGSQLKLPNLNLPVPKKSPAGRVDTKDYHLWRISLEKTISNNKLPQEAVLSLLATNVKLTSDEWLATFQSSSTLQEALTRLDTMHAPIQHLYGQLIRQITDTPALHGVTTTERIFQLNRLIQYVEEFLTFFGASTDLNREQMLIVLAKIADSYAGRDMSLRNIYAFDEAFRGGRPYAQSLKSHLIEARLLAVDLESALESIAESDRKKPANLRTAATAAEQQPARPGRPDGGEGRRGGAARAARPPAHCNQCERVGHMSYVCPDLKRIKKGEMKLKSSLCKHCLGKLDPDKPHPPDCATKRMFLDNAYVLLKFSCDHGIHVKICPSTKCLEAKTKKVLDPDQSPPPKAERSFTNLVVSLAQSTQTDQENKQVAFLKEVSALKGKDGQTLKCLVLFDTMGSRSFLRCKDGVLPQNFDWGSEPQMQTYSITTITGQQVIDKQVYELSLVSVRGLERVTAVAGGLEGQLYGGILHPELATAYGIDSPDETTLEEPSVVLILGSDKSHLMPRVRAPPRQLKRQQPGLMLADSVLSNRTLYFGTVQPPMTTTRQA